MIHDPPVDMLAPEGPSLIFAVLCFVTFAVFAVWSIYQSARTRDLMPLVLMVGGVACVNTFCLNFSRMVRKAAVGRVENSAGNETA